MGKERRKAAADSPDEIGAPIPGMITWTGPGSGARVKKGDKLLVMEAMKMQTTVYAPRDGIIEELAASVGETVDGGDLVVRLRAPGS